MEKQRYTGRWRPSRSSNLSGVPSRERSAPVHTVRGDPYTQQTNFSQHMRSTSSFQKRKPTADLPPRAQSSLGFTWNSRKSCEPQGFDIAGYLKRQGSAAEIRIGRNGRITNDEYLANYLRECRKQLQAEEEGLVCDLETESADIFGGIDLTQMLNPRSLREKRVPLCWEDQLQMAKPSSIKQPRQIQTWSVSVTGGKSEHNNMRREECLPDLEQLKNTSVMFSWRDMCLSGWTTVGHLNGSELVPRSAPHREDAPLACALCDTLTTELFPGLMQSDTDCSNMLCIWLKIGGNLQKKLTFDIFVTDTTAKVQQLSTKAFTQLKAKSISDTVVVLPLHLTASHPPSWVQNPSVCEWSGKAVTITVMLCEPRSMLFSVKAVLGTPDALDEQGGTHTEKFFKRRNSYCSEKDDEDRTDIRAISLEFPDLQVLDCDDSSPPPSSSSLPLL